MHRLTAAVAASTLLAAASAQSPTLAPYDVQVGTMPGTTHYEQLLMEGRAGSTGRGTATLRDTHDVVNGASTSTLRGASIASLRGNHALVVGTVSCGDIIAASAAPTPGPISTSR